ncbi:MAG: hypothetical protein OZSIB_0486 [Candidatus Ozemobacter sibiricus]|jgi:DNA-binding protein WhiA|uniref:Probable cell division protein WhiA n=1 Tax=Candidatus Ozemobacter sibiricus TaxID=2268124 RepID=A0A367ZLF4_9BACT|nr:MAG: hypothetical protein OZSIB_0486 [Candidatus Ozemobacter sibiricus]
MTTEPPAGRDYHLTLKREILESRLPLLCCRQAFLAGLSRRLAAGQQARLQLPKALRDAPLLERLTRLALPRRLAAELAPDRRTFPAALRQQAWQGFIRRLAEHLRGIPHRHCLRAWLRGMFVRGGYLQDPALGYHLEIMIRGRTRQRVFRLVARALRLPFRFCRRRDHVVAYLKGQAGLQRFLRAIEAFDRAMALQDLVAARQLLSDVNRQVNFETANINRAVAAAERQVERLRHLLAEADPEAMSDALRAMAELRVKYPEDSLEKLGQRFTPPLSKSAVNHRLRRLDELYRKLFPAPRQDEPPTKSGS